jgi:hypothetical protein
MAITKKKRQEFTEQIKYFAERRLGRWVWTHPVDVLFSSAEESSLYKTYSAQQLLNSLHGNGPLNTDQDTQFLLLWSALHRALRALLRQREAAQMEALGEALARATLKDLSRDRLEAWAVYHRATEPLDASLAQFMTPRGGLPWGLSSVAVLSVADYLFPELLPGLIQQGHPTFETFREIVFRALVIDADAMRRAHEAHLKRLHKLQPPSQPALQPAWSRLKDLHDDLATVTSPRLPQASRTASFELDIDTLSLHWKVRRSYECGGQYDDNVLSWHLENEKPSITCQCPLRPNQRCRYKLEAAEAFLQILQGDREPEVAPQLNQWLQSPRWQRWVDTLLQRAQEARQIPTHMEGQPAWFGWRFEGTTTSFSLRPVLVRGYKSRRDGVVARPLQHLDPFKAADELDDPRDRNLLRMWGFLGAYPTMDQWLNLTSLLDQHPRVYLLDGSTSAPLQVQIKRPQLVARQGDNGAVLFRVQADDQEWSPHDFQLLFERRFLAHNISLDLDLRTNLLTAWEVNPSFLQRLSALAVVPDATLPPEAQAYLLNRAPELTAARALDLGDGLRGREVDPRDDIAVHIAPGRAALAVELRAWPLPLAATVEPGDGPPQIFAVDDQGPLYCQRDLDAERARAAALADTLDLQRAPDQPGFRWELPLGDRALDLVALLKERAQHGLTVRWEQAPPAMMTGQSQQLSVRLEERRGWFKLGGELNLDEGAVPLRDLLEAAREGRRWVRVDQDRWVRLEDRLRRNLERVARVTDDDQEQISPLAADVLLQAQQDGAQIQGPARWLELTQRLEEAQHLQPAVPDSLQADLRPYQAEGVHWMLRLAHWAPGACLADDMGLGKTVQALALLLHRRGLGPTLVIAPTSVGFGWIRETHRFAPSLQTHHLKSGKEIEFIKDYSPGEVFVTSYDLMARHIDRWKEITWGTVIFDEAQALKNPDTLRARAATQLKAHFLLALTGTPLENNTGELWSLFHIIARGLLGSLGAFRQRFQLPIERHDDERARKALAALVSPFILRRLKRDVARDLPDRTDIRLDVSLSRAERALYDELRRAVLAQLESDAPSEAARFQILAAITRLRQLACHPRLYRPDSNIPSSKIELLREKIHEIRQEGHRALIFSQFTSLLALAREALEQDGVRCAWLDGSLSATARQKAVEDFQAGHADAFLLSIKAGGTGLNLTAASYVFLLDPWWNPAVEDQATDRAHRIGQTEPVTVYRLVAQGTIEDSIYALHEEKRALMDAVLEGSGSSGSLTPDELRALILAAPDADTIDMDDLAEHSDRAPRRAADLLAAPDGDPAHLTAPPDLIPAPPRALPAPTTTPRDDAPPKARAPRTPRAPAGAPSDALATFLEQEISNKNVSLESARVYRPKLYRLWRWLEREGIPLSDFTPSRHLNAYRDAIQNGAWDAPASDLAQSGTIITWMARFTAWHTLHRP